MERRRNLEMNNFQESIPKDYLSTLRERYSGQNQISYELRPKQISSRLNKDRWTDVDHEFSLKKRQALQRSKKILSKQKIESVFSGQYQSLLNKKIGGEDPSNPSLTDRIHLKLRDMNKMVVAERVSVEKAPQMSRQATNQINGLSKNNTKEYLFSQEKQASQFDSPIKLLYCQDKVSTQKKENKLAVQKQPERRTPTMRCKSSFKLNADTNYNSLKNNIQRQSNKNVISNVEKILGQIRKTLNI